MFAKFIIVHFCLYCNVSALKNPLKKCYVFATFCYNFVVNVL
nr:MAG TPA: hypothetical protein [Siphoviridae sp. ctdzB12]